MTFSEYIWIRLAEDGDIAWPEAANYKTNEYSTLLLCENIVFR